jgi:hypothetical protein
MRAETTHVATGKIFTTIKHTYSHPDTQCCHTGQAGGYSPKSRPDHYLKLPHFLYQFVCPKEIEMHIHRLFYFLIVLSLVVTACAPQIEATPLPTSMPPATLTPTAELTVTSTVVPTTTEQPTETAITIAADLPFLTGKYFHANDPTTYYSYRNGRWSHSVVGMQFALATGTYRVDGDLYIQESNSEGCPVPMSFKYTFDGKFLKFQLTDQSQNDTCDVRKDLHNNKTYILEP